MDLGLHILQLMLNEGGDWSTRAIARQLDTSTSKIVYHLKRLVTMGVLTREEVERGHVTYAYYAPQPLFTEQMEETVAALTRIAGKIAAPTDAKIANCITYFLQCYNVVDGDEAVNTS